MNLGFSYETSAPKMVVSTSCARGLFGKTFCNISNLIKLIKKKIHIQPYYVSMLLSSHKVHSVAKYCALIKTWGKCCNMNE